MAAKSYVYQVAANLDIHAESSSRVDSDGVKLFAAQTCKNIADRAIQCLGGYGYVADFEVCFSFFRFIYYTCLNE
jgi:isovaleryl-CoA dehydrogenase